MNILIVGGAGYIGGITARLFAEAGHTVTIFDNLSTGFKENTKDAPFIEGDLRQPEAIMAVIAKHKFDVILHFAAKLDVGESMQLPALYFENNVMGSLHLIDAAAKAQTPIIFSSSCVVYGDADQVPITETTPYQPINPYGYSKVMTEQLLQSYQKTDNLQWLALRYFNPVGSYDGIGQNPQVSNLVPAAMRALKEHKPLAIFGNDYDTPDGTCVRDYIDVRDVAEAHVIAAEKMVGGQIFNQAINLGSGQGYTVLQAIDALGKAAGEQIPREFVARRAGDAPKMIADASLAKKLLGWTARHTLDEMMVAAYALYKEK